MRAVARVEAAIPAAALAARLAAGLPITPPAKSSEPAARSPAIRAHPVTLLVTASRNIAATAHPSTRPAITFDTKNCDIGLEAAPLAASFSMRNALPTPPFYQHSKVATGS